MPTATGKGDDSDDAVTLQQEAVQHEQAPTMKPSLARRTWNKLGHDFQIF